MKEFLASGNVGNIEFNQNKKIREEIQQRWDALGFNRGSYWSREREYRYSI